MTRARILGGLLFLLLAIPGAAQEAVKVPDGFRSFLVRDDRYPAKDEKNRTGKLHCLVCEIGLNPGLAVFSRTIPKDANSPLVSLMKVQETLATKFSQQNLGTFVVFLGLTQGLSEDPARELKIAEVANFGRQAVAKNVPLGLAQATEPKGDKPEPTEQVKAWNIGEGDDITMVFYNRLNVVQRWKFGPQGPTEADLKAIEDVVTATLAKKKK